MFLPKRNESKKKTYSSYLKEYPIHRDKGGMVVSRVCGGKNKESLSYCLMSTDSRFGKRKKSADGSDGYATRICLMALRRVKIMCFTV